MSVKYEIVPATEEHILELARTMRKADVDEVWAAAHVSPELALRQSVAATNEPKTGLADGRVVCMFGVSTPTVLSDIGIPWLLATDELRKHSRFFLRKNSPYLAGVLKHYTVLTNFVDSRHTVAVRWLKWLGFTLFPAEPFGPDQVPFHRFEMRS